METRLVIAYLLIALMAAAFLYLTVAVVRKRRKARMTRYGHSNYNGSKSA